MVISAGIAAGDVAIGLYSARHAHAYLPTQPPHAQHPLQAASRCRSPKGGPQIALGRLCILRLTPHPPGCAALSPHSPAISGAGPALCFTRNCPIPARRRRGLARMTRSTPSRLILAITALGLASPALADPHRTMSFPHSIAGHWRQRHLRALMARTLADEHEIFVLSAISCQPGICVVGETQTYTTCDLAYSEVARFV